ncbi:DUF979 domain-containing protein [Pullulanibacillus sp. KACC 23026]|uniref:DUF979 domain-containing protein n=1 Tax=Pullulanibacillus sp. KACC 23026 TaxID=3028315 RepID=UPI0023AF7001|nr:DUF979 domain-containing protein [Pullulanibacillus sp. KACC 23026]WEG14464.1 DUF979 domain-containing protein [Pullulanibacillus sp. KACC 23026]
MHFIFGMEFLYYLIGIIVLIIAAEVLFDKDHPKRFTSGLFWLIFGVTFIIGDKVPASVIGYLVLVMVALTALGQVKNGGKESSTKEQRVKMADKLNNKIFIPALMIPVFTVIGTLLYGHIKFGSVNFVDPTQITLISLGIAAILAFFGAMWITKAKWSVPVQEGSRLLQSVGWAVILPQLLATLGGIFNAAGVGKVVSGIVSNYLPTSNSFVAVFAYCFGMMLFTMIMGNAFAAFAVITAGIGIPFIVHMHAGNPGIMAALGMFAGYSGTLMTPMAANFNIVPAMLFGLEDQNAVVKKQIPTGLAIFVADTLLMYFLVYHF